MGDIGSNDFRQVMENLDAASDHGTAKRELDHPEMTEAAVRHIREVVEHRLAQLLLARFLLLNLLVQEARKLPQGLDQKVHRRLWVLFQAQPTILDRTDVFTKLSLLLKCASTSKLKEWIDRCSQKFCDSLPKVRHPVTDQDVAPPVFCVLDEVQVTVTPPFGRLGESMSDTNTPCPILREVWRSWSETQTMRLVFSGTGVELQAFQDALTSVAFKQQPYRLWYDIGAFEDPQIQAEYITRYVPACLDSPRWKAFLTRAYAWLRGR